MLVIPRGRVAQRKRGVLTYLHRDHLGGTILATNGSGVTTGDNHYCGYGRRREGSEVVTAPKGHPRLAGQKLDGTGLQYFNAWYYDPELGTFISPDTVVPGAGNLFDYNRYMMVRGNPLKFNDPDGHIPCNPVLGQMICTIWQNLITSSDRVQAAVTPEHDAVGVYIPVGTDAVKALPVNAGGTGGFEVIRNRHTGVVTAFSVVGGGVEGTAGALIKPFQVTLINNIDDDNLNYSGTFAGVDVTLAGELGLTFGYAYTPRQEVKGWRVWEYLYRNDAAAYSFIVGPAGGIGASGSANVVYYTPLFDYVDGEIIPHNGQLTQEDIDYLLPIVEQGMGILDGQ